MQNCSPMKVAKKTLITAHQAASAAPFQRISALHVAIMGTAWERRLPAVMVLGDRESLKEQGSQIFVQSRHQL